MPFRDVHLLACRTLAEGLKGLGLMKGDLDEAVAQGAHAMFFQCGLGHMLGLDVHDMEDLGEVWVGYEGQPQEHAVRAQVACAWRGRSSRGSSSPSSPGIYFIPELIDRWQADGKFKDFINYDALGAYRDFGGVRIEENFVVLDKSCRRLGKERPRKAADIEALRA